MSRKYYNAKSNKDVAKLYYLDANNTKKVEIVTQTQFAWYFCILKEQAHEHLDFIKGMISDGLIARIEKDGPTFYKVFTHKFMYDDYCEAARVIKEFKARRIQMFEQDLKIHDRLFIDKDLKLEDNHIIGHFDIETDDRNPGVVPGRDRIVSLALKERNGKQHYWSHKSERVLLEAAFKEMSRFTILTGWHSAGFDWPAILQRAKDCDIQFPLWDVNHIDLLVWFKKAVEAGMLEERPKNYKLETVCEQYLGMKKTDGVKAGNGNIWKLFTEKPEELKIYNVQDTNLLYELDLKLGIVDQCIRQSVITKSFTGGLNHKQGICTSSELIDKFVLNLAHSLGRRLGSKNNDAKKPSVKRFVKKSDKKKKKGKDDE